MKERWVVGLTVFCIVGSGTDGGEYFAFSNFVMTAVQQLPTDAKIVAMQHIDACAENVWFGIALFGPGLASIALGINAFRNKGHQYIAWGSLLYLVSLAITFFCNVPLNNSLVSVAPNSSYAADAWSHFWTPWMAWNHTRTISALAACGLFGAGLISPRQGAAQ